MNFPSLQSITEAYILQTLKGNREKEAVGAQGHKSVQVLGVTSHQDSKPGPGRPQRIRAPPKMFGQQLGTQVSFKPLPVILQRRLGQLGDCVPQLY